MKHCKILEKAYNLRSAVTDFSKRFVDNLVSSCAFPQVSFQVSYQVAGSVKTLTSCQVSGCALTMPKPGQSVTVFVVASISGINSDEVTATGNTSKHSSPTRVQFLQVQHL